MSTACCKAGRVIDDYGIDSPAAVNGDIDDYFANRWTGQGQFRAVGYRELADWLNKRLIETTYIAYDRGAIEARVENEYSLLIGDDSPERDELMADLRGDEIDGEALASDLVSRSTMSRHLKECLDLEKEHIGADSSQNWELDRINYSRNTFRENVEAAVRSLTNKGTLPGGTAAEIELPVMLTCPECGTRVPLSAALRRGSICSEHLGRAEDG